MKNDPFIDLALRGTIGFGLALAAVGLLAMFDLGTGGLIIVLIGGMFALMGWAARRFFGAVEEEMVALTAAPTETTPPTETTHRRRKLDIGGVAGIVFGGFGAAMIVLALAMLADGDVEAFVGAGLFGLVFCGVGYGAFRVFRTPAGTARVPEKPPTKEAELTPPDDRWR